MRLALKYKQICAKIATYCAADVQFNFAVLCPQKNVQYCYLNLMFYQINQMFYNLFSRADELDTKLNKYLKIYFFCIDDGCFLEKT